jgi:hypothetical protein
MEWIEPLALGNTMATNVTEVASAGVAPATAAWFRGGVGTPGGGQIAHRAFVQRT